MSIAVDGLVEQRGWLMPNGKLNFTAGARRDRRIIVTARPPADAVILGYIVATPENTAVYGGSQS